MEKREGDVTIVGTGVIHVNVFTNSFKCSGSAIVNGKLDALEVEVNGSLKVDSDLVSKKLSLSGNLVTSGDAKVKECKIAGSAHIKKDMSGKNIEVKGSLYVDKSLLCDYFALHMDGNSTVRSQTTVKTFEIKLQEAKSGKLVTPSLRSVEGYLENSEVGYLETINVKLGPYCRIGKLKAKTFTKHETANIDEIIPWNKK